MHNIFIDEVSQIEYAVKRTKQYETFEEMEMK